ncbi:MAG: hypothetical protein COX66_00475 [Elusimicrobia bacterium CG_4_10_14_0_2_um_filter_63_34]|nr:MAG: hypothetical protein COX66_00475 [Elusimicrobia bacterium CG_4_10_14_0_2_um_filter_63_34]
MACRLPERARLRGGVSCGARGAGLRRRAFTVVSRSRLVGNSVSGPGTGTRRSRVHRRGRVMPRPSLFELTMLCCVVGVVQLIVAVRFSLRTLFVGGNEAPDAEFSATVFVPCAGDSRALAENAASLLDQDFAGRLRFVFVTPAKQDPAFGVLRAVVGDREDACVLASELVPTRSSGKITDLLFALESDRFDSGAWVFADCDQRFRSDWLRRLCAPIADASAEVATAATYFAPSAPSAGALLRSVWMTWGLPYFEWANNVTGQSFAISPKAFRDAEVSAVWSHSLYEDLALTRIARSRGLRVRFVHGAMPYEIGSARFGETLALFNKWMTAYRLFEPRVWWMGLLLTAFKLYAAFRAAAGGSLELAAALVAADAAALLATTAALEASFYPRLGSVAAALARTAAASAAVPALWLLLFVNYFASLRRTIDWGPYRYEVRGVEDVRVEKR